MSDVASPPATSVWWDETAVVADVLHILRLQGGDVDTNRIKALIPPGGRRIEVHVDRVDPIPGPPPSSLYHNALVQLVVQRYQKNQPVAVLGTFPSVDDETYLLDSLLPGERERWPVS